MKSTSDCSRITAVFLLAFLVVVAVVLWLLNLVTQQRVFGFLMSAEFVAFALLVYIFYQENLVSKKLLAAGFVALGVLVLLAAIVFVGVG
jgi:ATP/ADP translocase